MIIKTFRDVEIEFYKLQSELRKVIAAQGANQSIALTPEQVLRIIKSNQVNIQQVQPAQDIDSTFDGGVVLHNQEHHFLNSLKSGDVGISGGLYIGEWNATTELWITTRITAARLDTIGYGASGEVFVISYNVGATVADSSIIFEGVIGDVTAPVEKIYVKDLEVSGTVTGIGGGGSVSSANSSATVTLTTSFADVTGATLSLTVNGTYLIHACFVFVQVVNDTECQGQVVHDDSGAFVALTGIVRSSKDSSANLNNTCEKTWVVTIASQPTTIKLQAKKTGTGTSYTDITNCSIIAHLL